MWLNQLISGLGNLSITQSTLFSLFFSLHLSFFYWPSHSSKILPICYSSLNPLKATGKIPVDLSKFRILPYICLYTSVSLLHTVWNSVKLWLFKAKANLRLRDVTRLGPVLPLMFWLNNGEHKSYSEWAMERHEMLSVTYSHVSCEP